MQESDIIERIMNLCEARSWTLYRLAKESGITYSTLCTMLHKTTSPSISTLTKICNGFGITLSQFFDLENEYAFLTNSEKAYLEKWRSLTKENQLVIEKNTLYLLNEQNNNT